LAYVTVVGRFKAFFMANFTMKNKSLQADRIIAQAAGNQAWFK
jgi:hypothetical protein